MLALSFAVQRKSFLLSVAALALPVVMLLALLVPTVFAQTTYVITDGDQVKVYTTYVSDPADVLDRAGVTLGEDDTYTTQPGDDGVSEITVQRLQTIALQNCGQTQQLTTYGETVGQLLARIGIDADNGEYAVSVALDAQTFDGMELQVDYVIAMEQTYTVEIPNQIIEVYDPSMEAGERKIVVEGTAGQLLKTANVVYVNSQETEHTVISETVLEEPVDQIVRVGTGENVGKPGTVAIGNGLIITADGQVLTYYKKDRVKTTAYSHLDPGCDMITATGTTVRHGTVAIDPKVVPYGTRMFIIWPNGEFVYGIATAEDCGGAIKGKEIDLYMPTREICFEYGVHQADVYFLD